MGADRVPRKTRSLLAEVVVACGVLASFVCVRAGEPDTRQDGTVARADGRVARSRAGLW